MPRALALVLGALLLAAGLLAGPARAQYALRASVVAAGATDAAGGSYRLRATVGQPAVGPVAGGAFAVGQGFWYPATLSGGGGGPLVDLTLTPTNPPPPVMITRGATLRYRATFAIAANGPSTFQYWAEARLPSNQWRALFGPITVTGTPGTTVTRNLQQRVPGNVPLGNYVFRMKVGTYPGTVLDEDSFPVTIVAGAPALAAQTTRRTADPAATRTTGEPAAADVVSRQASREQAVATRTAPTTVERLPAGVPVDGVPEAIARRIAEDPDAWLAWDEDGTMLEAGLVQDFRFATDEEVAREAAEQERAPREAAHEATTDTAVLAATIEVPTAVTLAPAFPNPGARTTLRFGLPAPGPARLAVYDVQGRRVALLVDAPREAGWHAVAFDGHGLASGVYLVRLEAGATILTQRLSVVR